MAKPGKAVRSFFAGVARVQREFTIEVGPVRATGVPAVLVAVTGIVVASGFAAVLRKNAERLPETLREARGLAETLRGDHRRLNP